MPEALIRLMCEAADATVACMRALAARFNVSLTAAALRFVDFAQQHSTKLGHRGLVLTLLMIE